MASAGPSEAGNAQVENYCLSKVISAHKGEVKALALTQAGAIISAGRDENVCFWSKKAGEYVAVLKLKQPKDMVINSLAHVETEDGWRLFVGRKDGSIAMYGSGSTEPMQIFREHSSNVCCLFADQKNEILMSGSWDTHVIIWPFSELSKPEFAALSLRGHTLSVWALASFPDRPDHYLTGGADKTIKLWEKDNELFTFKGHEDVVRALIVMSNAHFLSAANDGYIRYWDVGSGTCLGRFKTKSHDYIYGMTLCDSHILTTGEDGTLEFWSMSGTAGDGKKLMITSESVLQTPSVTTWDVKVLPSSDLAVSGSDGRIYILSKDRARCANAAISEAFDAEVVAKLTAQAARSNNQSDTIVINVSLNDDAPANMQLRYKKGTDPAISAQNFINQYGLPQTYKSEIIEYICSNIPEANAARYSLPTPAASHTNKASFATFESVFKTQLDDGKIHEIPYNRGEDPNTIAQRYAEKHNLSIGAMQTITYLLANELSAQQSQFDDPFTGSGRYIPGGSGNSNSGGYVDPFTGEGRYVPGQSGSNSGSGFSGDPLTGDGGYRIGDSTGALRPVSSMNRDKLRPVSSLVPPTEFYKMESISAKAFEKLKENNANREDFKLDENQIGTLIEMVQSKPENDFWSPTIKSAFETALQWPIDEVSPVLDFLRVGLLHKSVNSCFCGKEVGPSLVNRFIAILISSTTDKAVKIFICRCIANAFVHPAGADLFSSTELNTLAPLVANQLMDSNKAAQSSAAIAFTNWANVLHSQSVACAQLGPKEDLLRAVITALNNVQSFGDWDTNTLLRVLQTIGTLMWGDAVVVRFAKDHKINGILARLMDATPSETAKSMARDITEMTHAV